MSIQKHIAKIITQLEKSGATQTEIAYIFKTAPTTRAGLHWFKNKSYPELYTQAKQEIEQKGK